MSTTEANHTVFTLGRGSDAEALGEFRDYLPPEGLISLPVGQELLTATTTAQVRTCFARFALAWDVAGCSPFTPPQSNTHVPAATPHPVPWVPYAQRQDVYAFDEGRWFLWQALDAPQWHTATLSDPGSVVTHPTARVYGRSYTQTEGLRLDHLAMWIMAEVTARLDRRGLTLSACVHLGGNLTEPSIHLTAHGTPPDQISGLAAELDRIAQAHNWSNPCDADDIRFHFSVSRADAATSPGGQLCVITDDDFAD